MNLNGCYLMFLICLILSSILVLFVFYDVLLAKNIDECRGKGQKISPETDPEPFPKPEQAKKSVVIKRKVKPRRSQSRCVADAGAGNLRNRPRSVNSGHAILNQSSGHYY